MKIVFISDFGILGSGYKSISAPLCQGLSKNHKVWVIGLNYEGHEHDWNFSLVPARNFKEMGVTVQNIYNEHKFDVCMIALDIPMQEQIMNMFSTKPFKYVGIFPLESNPCILDTAMLLMQMDRTFCISQFGTDEINVHGVNTKHLRVGMDTDVWKRRTKDDYKMYRERFGFSDDDFVVLSVADNQERKNISASMEIISKLKNRLVPVKFVLVTRPNLPVGWKLQSYANEVGIADNYIEINRGIPVEDLWIYYAMSDVFLSTTKAEGLSMPVLEAMSIGVPVVAPNHTALQEHLSDDRGFPVGWEYTHRDPFLNGYRYWVDKRETEDVLFDLWKKIKGGVELIQVENAYEYVKGRNWDDAINLVEEVLSELKDE